MIPYPENLMMARLPMARAPRRLLAAVVLLCGLPAPAAHAQSAAARLSILQAEDRRAPSPTALAVIRAGARSGDGQTARIALRALGRLERPALIPDILPGLRHSLPEVRAEAANAVAQAAQGLRGSTGTVILSLVPAQAALITRLGADDMPAVRAAVAESLARLPYTSAADVARAETALLDFVPRATSNTDRLGLAKALEAFTRLQRTVRQPGADVATVLRRLARNEASRPDEERLRDTRVRRLALESLITLGAADVDTIVNAASDPDPQVRRLAVRAATLDGAEAVVARGLNDPVPMVRIEALRTSRARNARDACGPALAGASDPDMHAATVAIDQLSSCGDNPQTIAYLTHALSDRADAEAPRNWHRAGHALVALATAAPAEAREALEAYASSRVWQLRVAAARAAGTLGMREALERLARDTEDNVVEAAVTALNAAVGHDADELYTSALASKGYQVVRVAARALEGSPRAGAVVPALRQALDRADDDDRPGAADARAALRAALTSLGTSPRASRPVTLPAAPLTVADLRRLAAPRARFTIRDVGVFDVALFAQEAPATVLRFVELASSGYYDGLTFHRVVPNGIIQGGSPGANEYSSNAPFMRDEVGLWPHVRGAVGISTRGRDTGDGQIFVNLVDNPRYDHTYTVFAQVLNGLDIVDRILEGDVIESVEIVP